VLQLSLIYRHLVLLQRHLTDLFADRLVAHCFDCFHHKLEAHQYIDHLGTRTTKAKATVNLPNSGFNQTTLGLQCRNNEHNKFFDYTAYVQNENGEMF